MRVDIVRSHTSTLAHILRVYIQNVIPKKVIIRSPYFRPYFFVKFYLVPKCNIQELKFKCSDGVSVRVVAIAPQLDQLIVLELFIYIYQVHKFLFK